MAKVTVIPSTINPVTQLPNGAIKKRNVAAYARVSTDSDEQFTSYEAQMTYYKKYITERPDWRFVDVYSDEGITGTNTKRREGFNRLIEDAYAGKIDLIITKSISRFARNTLDTIKYTRELKNKGVEVYFEKENLWTFDPKSEFILTICASIAQEESRSISQNVTMGRRWSMQEGKVVMAFSTFLGYEKKPDGSIGINEEQAKVVRMIYRLFLVEGKTASGIANYLNSKGIPTPSGREGCKWTKTTVDSILTNEKYKGDALLQKTFMVDFLEHKAKKNEGEVPSYYVENSHPAIIERDEWEMVQAEFVRRSNLRYKYSGYSEFASRIICEDCGGFYGAKVWHSTDKYRKVVYQCNNKFKKDHKKCKTPIKTEEEIKSLFIKAYNLMMLDREQMIDDCLDVKRLLTDTTQDDAEITRLEKELTFIAEQVEEMIKFNAMSAQDQDEYTKHYDELATRYDETKAAYDKVVEERKVKLSKAQQLDAFLYYIKNNEAVITEWSSDIWNVLVESGTVCRDGSIIFKFKNGKQIRVGGLIDGRQC